MLLIDGVKYELWTPPTEDEFERMVKEHAQDIFGEQSIYLDRKQKLKSLSGIGSIPDGYVIVFGASPEWHIVEVELSSHPLYEHIVSQVSKFINGISNPNIQRNIVNAIDGEINRNGVLRLRLKKAVEPTEIYRFLSDLISKQPTLTIIIEKDTEELREALSTLRYPQIKVVEFRTFVREGVGLAVHAHLFGPLYKFEPLYKPVTATEPQPPPQATVAGSFKIRVVPEYINDYYIYIPKLWKELFPAATEELKLETDIGVIETRFNVKVTGNKYRRFLSGGELVNWFKAHPELKVGDKLLIMAIEPMKKYRLEILKE